MSEKTYTLAEVREKYFPNFRECGCGSFKVKEKMHQCFHCKKWFCTECFSEHSHGYNSHGVVGSDEPQ